MAQQKMERGRNYGLFKCPIFGEQRTLFGGTYEQKVVLVLQFPLYFVKLLQALFLHLFSIFFFEMVDPDRRAPGHMAIFL